MKTIFSITLMLLVQTLVSAQDSTIGVSLGYTTNGVAMQTSYNHGLSQKDYLQAAIFVSFAKTKHENIDIPYNDLSVNLGYFYTLYQDPYNRFYFSIGGGGVVGYESINKGNEELSTGAVIDGKSKFLYGAYAGAEADYLVSDNISIAAVINQYYHINSDLGNHSFYSGVGIKYLLF